MKRQGWIIVIPLFLALVRTEAQEASEPPELTAMRVQFEERMKAAVLPVMRAYGRALREKMTEFTQAGKLDEAIAFKKEMERVAAEIMAATKAGEGDTTGGPTVATRRKVVDFLEIIDVEQDGKPPEKWAMEDGKLLCVRGSMVPKIILPYEPPEEYDLTMTFEQPRLRNGVSFIIPNGSGEVFTACAAERGGMMSGLSVGGRYDPRFWTQKAGLFKPDKEYTFKVEVRKDSVRGMVDGEEMFSYEGEFSALSTIVWLKHPQVKQLAISADDPAVFTRLEVEEVTGEGKLLRKK